MKRRVFASPHRTQPKSGMSPSEEAYAERLRLLEAAGQVLWWRYAPMSLRLAKDVHYRADFLVLEAREDGSAVLALHEVKAGPWTEEAWSKFKVVLEMYWMFRFVVASGKKQAKRAGGGYEWTLEEF